MEFALTLIAALLLLARCLVCGRPMFSAVSIFTILNLLSLWLGFHIYGIDTAGASIILDSPPAAFRDIFVEALALIVAFSIGALGASVLRPCGRSGNHSTADSTVQVLLKRISINYVSIGTLFALFTFTMGNGVEGFFYRNEYMTESSQIAKSLGTVSTLCALFVVGVRVRAHSFEKPEGSDTGYRWHLVILVILTLTAYAAYSSRMLAVGAIIFAVGHVSNERTKKSMVVLIVAAIASPFLLHTALFMRGEAEQGFFPTIKAVFSLEMWRALSFLALLNNVGTVNFVITALTATLASIDTNYIITSINPLPGFLTDWYELDRGLNSSTPYSAMGEWLAFGWWPGVSFYMALGTIYDDVEYRSQRGQLFSSTVGVALLSLAAVTMLQYNTRSALRLVYYFYLSLPLLAVLGRAFREFRSAGVPSQ